MAGRRRCRVSRRVPPVSGGRLSRLSALFQNGVGIITLDLFFGPKGGCIVPVQRRFIMSSVAQKPPGPCALPKSSNNRGGLEMEALTAVPLFRITLDGKTSVRGPGKRKAFSLSANAISELEFQKKKPSRVGKNTVLPLLS